MTIRRPLDPRCPAPGNATPPRQPIVGDIVHVYGPNGEGPYAAVVLTVNEEEVCNLMWMASVLPPSMPPASALGTLCIDSRRAKHAPKDIPTPDHWNWPTREKR